MKHITTASATSPGVAVHRCYDALLSGHRAAAQAVLDAEVNLHVPGSHPLAGAHHGPDAVLAFIDDSRALTDSGERIDVLDVLAGREYAAAYCRVTAERNDRRLDNTTVHLIHVREGRIAEIWLHNWDDRTVNDFWS